MTGELEAEVPSIFVATLVRRVMSWLAPVMKSIVRFCHFVDPEVSGSKVMTQSPPILYLSFGPGPVGVRSAALVDS